LRVTARLLASGASVLVFEAMPAQAIADTSELLTISCKTARRAGLRESFLGAGGVGGPSLGKLTLDIAARCEWKEVSLASHTEKGTPLHKSACCELTTITFQTFECQLCS
ncbi:hypothetical protein HaLaN_33169, partial [Haematococcus lacustris]